MARKKLLILILLISCLAALTLPLFTNLYLYPVFESHIISDTEKKAKEVANHLIHYFEEPPDSIDYSLLTFDVKDEVEELHRDFGCEKIKIFSKMGEILFSTDPDDIGKINTKDYFKSVVEQGLLYTQIVRKDSTTAEGRFVPVDVVEIYVPLIFSNNIAGAIEVYFNITEHRKYIADLIKTSTFIGLSITGILLAAIFASLYWLNKNMLAREKADKELAEHRDKLKEQVKEQTAELREANIRLAEDIERRRQAEKELMQSEQKYHKLAQSASDGIFIVDVATGLIVDVNQQGLKLLGRSLVEVVGEHHSLIYPSEEKEKYDQLFKESIGHITSPDTAYHILHIDGYSIPVEISTSFIELDGGKIIQGIFRDIRERLKMEEEIQKAQRLESIALLAGGIAHDFNNLLAAVLGNISLAKLFAKPHEQLYNRLIKTEKAIFRIKALTKQLLTFAKGGQPVTETVNLSKAIIESTEFVLHGSTLKCEFDLEDSLWLVDADLGQINQVIQNLVVNASQEMEGCTGTLQLEAKNIIISNSAPLPLEAGKYIRISVHDEGGGIAPENIDKIFDPYFTTKETGTGLGLPTAYSIVKKHGGLLTVDSKVNRGTSFHIFLKASDRVVQQDNTNDKEHELVMGKGNILLMDDEESVREIAGDLIQYLGYNLETACDGTEAIDIYKEYQKEGKQFDAVIIDLTVPGGMDGIEMLKELKKIDQTAKTIVSSGYANNPVLAQHKEHGFDGRIIKPYEIEELSEVLHQLITTTSE